MVMRSFFALGLAFVALGMLHAGCSESAEDDDDHTTSTPTATTTGTGSTTTSSTSGSGGSGGSAPLTCSQPVTNVEGECDLLAQDCPDGYWCTIPRLVNPPAATCIPHMGGLKPAGSACEFATECALGLNCVDSKCSAVCCPPTDEPCGDGTCDIHVSLGGGLWVMYCSYNPSCHIFQHDCPQTPTGDPMDCHVQDQQQGLAVCDERSDSWVDEGGPCEYRNDCGDSQRCNRTPPDNGICRYHCKVDSWETEAVGDGGCPAAQHCVDLGWPAFPNLGQCAPD